MHKPVTLITSYPKSGNNYLKYLIYSSLHGAFTTSQGVRTIIPNIHHIDQEGLKEIEKLSSSIFLKSHFQYSSSHPIIDSVQKCIYLVRHPLDVLASRKNHYITSGLKKLFDDEASENFFLNELKLTNTNNSNKRVEGNWNQHVKSWLETNKTIPTIIIKYEDLIADPSNTLKTLFQSLDLTVSSEQIKKAIDLCSLEKMKQLEIHELKNKIEGQFYSPERLEMYENHKVLRVNKGKKGEYKNQMSPKMQSKCLAFFKNGMELAGYI